MYIFKGKPNLLVTTKKTQLFNNKVDYMPLFRFDENGEFRTEDESLIKRIKGRFDHVKVESNDITLKEEEKPTETIIELENDLSELSYNELRKLAKDRGIEFDKNPKKEDLLEVLDNA